MGIGVFLCKFSEKSAKSLTHLLLLFPGVIIFTCSRYLGFEPSSLLPNCERTIFMQLTLGWPVLAALYRGSFVAILVGRHSGCGEGLTNSPNTGFEQHWIAAPSAAINCYYQLNSQNLRCKLEI